jgi:hypothetical protein
MTSTLTTSATTTSSTKDFMKCSMKYALSLSLVLHIGAAVVVIIASGFSTGGKSSTSFIIQDVSLTPSISAPAQSMIAPPSRQHPARSTSTPRPPLETKGAVQGPTPEQPSDSSSSSGKEGGLMSTPLGLGMTHGYFSGLADGRSLRDDIRGYYFEMVEKINRQWWDNAGLLKEPLRQDGIFEVQVQRDGTIVSIRILRRTGSNEADLVITEIIRSTSPLPPLPSSYDQGLFRAPLRIKAPSFLFRIKN